MLEKDIAQPVVLEAWKKFIVGGQAEVSVRQEVRAAWERSKESGVSPDLITTPRVPDAEISVRLLENKNLLQIAQPVINTLYQMIKGTGYIVTLSDAEGCFLYIVGDKDAMRASSGSVVVGSDWSEEKVGANSIGTAIRMDQPVQMYGYEHYTKISHKWAGSGCPIHDENGRIVGVLSICCEIKDVNPQTFNMVVMVAHNIEMQLNLNKTAGHLYSVRQTLQRLSDSIPEGLLIINACAEICFANEIFQRLIGLKEAEMLGAPIQSLPLEKGLLRILEKGQEITHQEFRVDAVLRKITTRHIMLEDKMPGLMIIIENAETENKGKSPKKDNDDGAEMYFEDIIGQNERLQYGLRVARVAANTSANILVLGESGTGKDIIAQAIHNAGSHKSGPFVAINCAAIPKELFASTLFGYEEGAFTGARRGGSPGKLEQANKGTIFLDEIAEIPLEFQTVLLRALETKRFYRVGGKHLVTVDVQIVAATNRNLAKEVREGRFRQDLYYRLNVLAIHLPPLRERYGDISLLAEYFLEKLCKKYNKDGIQFQPEAIRVLEQYDWPGNIRELQNTIERAVVLCENQEITEDFMSMLIQYSVMDNAIAPETSAEEIIRKEPVMQEKTLESVSSECEELRQLLQKYHWNLSRISRELGIARSTLYRKIEKYQLNNPAEE